MSRRPRRTTAVRKSRTTLTLPADSLKEAHRIARSRNVNLSTVIAEALAEGLRLQTAAERSTEVLDGYTKAFAGFTDEEIAVLDGIILEPVRRT
jgi:post-segregation antitoxin (ccd killing protein)